MKEPEGAMTGPNISRNGAACGKPVDAHGTHQM